ncbi:MAG: DUF1292 domain-containing protein [Christensenellaceae bacterium]|jgi:uncharacterized protein YrzB (UPF0473 family)|nr:DUF1292 domain-containing protein [Christensenellaceae bacterium]
MSDINKDKPQDDIDDNMEYTDVIVFEDENGKEAYFEELARFPYKDEMYIALVPFDENEDDDDSIEDEEDDFYIAYAKIIPGSTDDDQEYEFVTDDDLVEALDETFHPIASDFFEEMDECPEGCEHCHHDDEDDEDDE